MDKLDLFTPPAVSIVIPCHNAAHTLARALNSCLRQEHVAQIIVVDDACTDSSAQIVHYFALKDARVELIACAENGGPANARNLGASHARHPVLAFLDADDEYLDGALSTAVAYLVQNAQQPAIRFDVDFSTFPEPMRAAPDFERHAQVMSDTVASSLVIRRQVFIALGGFPLDEIFRRHGGEDSALSNAINEIFGCFRLLERKWVRVHHHENSHVARYFLRSMGVPMDAKEHRQVVEAIDRFVDRARRALQSGSAA